MTLVFQVESAGVLGSSPDLEGGGGVPSTPISALRSLMLCSSSLILPPMSSSEPSKLSRRLRFKMRTYNRNMWYYISIEYRHLYSRMKHLNHRLMERDILCDDGVGHRLEPGLLKHTMRPKKKKLLSQKLL